MSGCKLSAIDALTRRIEVEQRRFVDQICALLLRGLEGRA